jgi:hypothetical protein
MATGLSPQHYVELVGVVTSAIIIDTLHASLGLPLAVLPEPMPGAPGGHWNEAAVTRGAWVPVSDAADEATATGMPAVPNIVRALGLVPTSVALFFTTFRPHYALTDLPLALDQAQAEFIAARVSALNQCFY